MVILNFRIHSFIHSFIHSYVRIDGWIRGFMVWFWLKSRRVTRFSLFLFVETYKNTNHNQLEVAGRLGGDHAATRHHVGLFCKCLMTDGSIHFVCGRIDDGFDRWFEGYYRVADRYESQFSERTVKARCQVPSIQAFAFFADRRAATWCPPLHK